MTFWVSGTTASVDATAVVALADLGVDGAVAVADPSQAKAPLYPPHGLRSRPSPSGVAVAIGVVFAVVKPL